MREIVYATNENRRISRKKFEKRPFVCIIPDFLSRKLCNGEFWHPPQRTSVSFAEVN
jgi:hypothetical protein